MRIEETGITQNKIYFEYIVSAGFIVCCYLLYLVKNKIDKNLFVFLEISFLCKVVSELLFTRYMGVTDFYNMIGHIFKVISYYYLYLGIIVNGLQRPYDMIKHDLDNVGSVLKENDKLRCYMEEVLYQNEKCYDWIINNSSNGIIIVRNHMIVYANKTALYLLGARDINDVSNKNVKEFMLDDTIGSNNFAEIVNSPIFNEIRLLKINKETIDVEYTINSIMYRGTPAYLILLRDINLKKEVNNLKNNLIENEIELNKSNEFNKVLTEFFSNISHDLKTPINVILSAVQLLMSKKNTENKIEFEEQLNRLLIIIKQNSFRLIRLVSNLIDTSKYESGFLKLELKNHNIVSIVEDITMSVSDYIKSKGVNIIFDTDDEERIIAVDADKIERIMLNLLSNAVKFTDKGGEILVNIENDVDYVRISVKDSGIGIPEEKIKLIFDRFAQVDNSLIRNKEGSGIGLSLVKLLIEMHGGYIKVNSTVGEGSEFIVELPVTLTQSNEMESLDYYNCDNKIEKILIEFSDIYSID
jgi:signal transduction histidine kinase